jgi:hypothetical protein
MIKIKKIKVIKKKGGSLLIKFANAKDVIFKKIKEIYISEIFPNENSNWKYYRNRNQILTIVSGALTILYKKNINDKIKYLKISYPKNLYRVFIPKKIFYTFICNSKSKAIIVNMIDEIVK